MKNTKTDNNHLALEKSPYLLQHADNPVDWYPWCDQAFEKAKAEDKPVFLSIGYATCHWCHVMAHESFEDEEVAQLMNEAFVSVKVDREERPDIDNIYMTVAQLLTGSGGWPLTIVMTPDKKPFFAATYIPKTARFGRKGMMEMIPEIVRAWKTQRDRIESTAGQIVNALISAVDDKPGKEAPGEEVFHLAFSQLAMGFDHVNGGFGKGMKFPTPHQLLFLLRYHRRTGNAGALEMVEKTLKAMRYGGIYDHVGLGFHRYSTDPEWLVPHFEKMLYDQALLLEAYLEAYQLTGNAFYGDTAREIIAYVLRDMTSPQGGFYSAEDADSEGKEGQFYVWTHEELTKLLSYDDAELLFDVYNVTETGNFGEEDVAGGHGNILHMKDDLKTIAIRHGLSETEIVTRIRGIRERLHNERSKRVRPLKDDKILTDWNGLMIAALAKAGRVLGDRSSVDAAAGGALFIRRFLTGENGRLHHRYRQGEGGLPAHLDDYAFYIHSLIELYQTTFDTQYLADALRLADTMLQLFKDDGGGSLFLSAMDTETVLVRAKELYDGALPSGNAVAMLNLIRLSKLTGRTELEEVAKQIASAAGDGMRRTGIQHTMSMVALDFAVGPSIEVVVAGREKDDDTQAMLDALNRMYMPSKVVILRDEQDVDSIAALAPFVIDQPMKNNRATVYVCVDHMCSFPTNDPVKMVNQIEKRLVKIGNKKESDTKSSSADAFEQPGGVLP